MIVKVSDNIISPLGLTSGENFSAVLSGRSELRMHTDVFGLPEPFVGSLFDRDMIDRLFAGQFNSNTAESFSFFERISMLSAARAIDGSGIDPAANDVIFVLSTTKGNVDSLESDIDSPDYFIGESARRIASAFGNRNQPIVASNACISGIAAQIAAIRALLSGRYAHAVVIGADCLSKFIVSGFQSFKALGSMPCRPYDSRRDGLNLGEAAGTMVLSTTDIDEPDSWHYRCSSINNDANHISGPSRTGEGAFRALTALMTSINPDDIAFINAHGTATLYNDEMESIAINRAGLSEIPVCGFKGIFGHTLGAAGIIETILSMHAADAGLIPPTCGFEKPGTSRHLNVSPSRGHFSGKNCFIKLLSGFGGSNAAIAYAKGGDA